MGKIVRRSVETLAVHENDSSATDWQRVDNFSDDELARNAQEDPDNPPVNDEEFARMRPAHEVLPELVGAEHAAELFNRRGRPKKDTTKQQVTLRLSPEVIDYFRSTGRGWQSRIDEVLRESVKKRSRHKTV